MTIRVEKFIYPLTDFGFKERTQTSQEVAVTQLDSLMKYRCNALIHFVFWIASQARNCEEE